MKAVLLGMAATLGLLGTTAAEAHDYVVLARVVSIEAKVVRQHETVPVTTCSMVDFPIYNSWDEKVGFRRERECTTTMKTRSWNETRGYLINYVWNGYYGQFPSTSPYTVGETVNIRMTLTGGL